MARRSVTGRELRRARQLGLVSLFLAELEANVAELLLARLVVFDPEEVDPEGKRQRLVAERDRGP